MYVIREVEPECTDFSFYFDNDGFRKEGGEFCYSLFMVRNGYYGLECYYNEDDFKDIVKEFNNIMDDIEGMPMICGWNDYKSLKEIMIDYKLDYTPKKARTLWEIYKGSIDVDAVCKYLTLKTDRKWDYLSASGYCQGDYVNVIYCEDFYSIEDIKIAGDLWLGCGKEFSITDDNNDTVYGFYVADCQGYKPNDYLTLVCDMDGIDYKDATLELIEDVKTIRVPSYNTYTYECA